MNNIFFGIEKLSLVDFENKLTCTLFTRGCNFRCPFCHNADLVLSTNLMPIAFDEIISYLKKRSNILDAVCITGGEPTLMPNLVECIKAIKELGYLVKLDTNGTNLAMIKQLVDNKLIDYIAMDIKNSISSYPKTVGLANINSDVLVDTIEYLKANHINYEFRTTLVQELHNEADIIAIGQLLKGAKILYLQKFTDHQTCLAENLHEVPKEKALDYKHLLNTYIDKVELRGY